MKTFNLLSVKFIRLIEYASSPQALQKLQIVQLVQAPNSSDQIQSAILKYTDLYNLSAPI